MIKRFYSIIFLMTLDEECLKYQINLMRLLLFLLSILYLTNVGAQEITSRWALEAGVGNYEAIHIGASYDFNNNSELAFGLGYNLGAFDQRVFTVKVEDRFFIMPNTKKLKATFISVKVLFWTLEDVSYNWYVLSTQFVLGHQFVLSDNLKLSIDGGYSLNVFDTNSRDNFEELGYPRRNNGVFNVTMLYKF